LHTDTTPLYELGSWKTGIRLTAEALLDFIRLTAEARAGGTQERGSSSIFTGSGGAEYRSELQLLRVMVDKSMDELAGFCQGVSAPGQERRPIHEYLQQV
jgi:hypothetical protein